MKIYNVDKDGSYGNWKEKANRAFSYKVAMGDGDSRDWLSPGMDISHVQCSSPLHYKLSEELNLFCSHRIINAWH